MAVIEFLKNAIQPDKTVSTKTPKSSTLPSDTLALLSNPTSSPLATSFPTASQSQPYLIPDQFRAQISKMDPVTIAQQLNITSEGRALNPGAIRGEDLAGVGSWFEHPVTDMMNTRLRETSTIAESLGKTLPTTKTIDTIRKELTAHATGLGIPIVEIDVHLSMPTPAALTYLQANKAAIEAGFKLTQTDKTTGQLKTITDAEMSKMKDSNGQFALAHYFSLFTVEKVTMPVVNPERLVIIQQSTASRPIVALPHRTTGHASSQKTSDILITTQDTLGIARVLLGERPVISEISTESETYISDAKRVTPGGMNNGAAANAGVTAVGELVEEAMGKEYPLTAQQQSLILEMPLYPADATIHSQKEEYLKEHSLIKIDPDTKAWSILNPGPFMEHAQLTGPTAKTSLESLKQIQADAQSTAITQKYGDAKATQLKALLTKLKDPSHLKSTYGKTGEIYQAVTNPLDLRTGCTLSASTIVYHTITAEDVSLLEEMGILKAGDDAIGQPQFLSISEILSAVKENHTWSAQPYFIVDTLTAAFKTGDLDWRTLDKKEKTAYHELRATLGLDPIPNKDLI